MAITINADTSNGLVMTPDTSGQIKLQAGGADIATVSSTGIAMAAGKTLPASALTGTLPAIDGSSLTNLPAPAALSTASGSAPSYSARAWVNFNGTGTVAIRNSGNVSSITDNGTGLYTVNFTTAMPDSNYTTTAMCRWVTSGDSINTAMTGNSYSASSVQFRTGTVNWTLVDSNEVSAAIFR